MVLIESRKVLKREPFIKLFDVRVTGSRSNRLILLLIYCRQLVRCCFVGSHGESLTLGPRREYTVERTLKCRTIRWDEASKVKELNTARTSSINSAK